MFDNRFYRAGNVLVSLDGVVIEGHSVTETSMNSRFSIHVPGNGGEVTIRREDHPEEYAQYCALYDSAPLLISRLTQVQEGK